MGLHNMHPTQDLFVPFSRLGEEPVTVRDVAECAVPGLMRLPFESGREMEIMPKRIPEETKQRAIRLVLDHLDEDPTLTAACESVSKRLGFGVESLRRWVSGVRVESPHSAPDVSLEMPLSL